MVPCKVAGHVLFLWACSCGPGIVPRGVLRQDNIVGRMRFDIPKLIADNSAHIRLEVGDIIATGSPVGSGGFQSPLVYLRAGDVVRCAISEIGSLENHITMEG